VVVVVVLLVVLWRIINKVATMARMAGGCKYGDQAKLLMESEADENVASESACFFGSSSSSSSKDSTLAPPGTFFTFPHCLYTASIQRTTAFPSGCN
jgi:hypothetical protein